MFSVIFLKHATSTFAAVNKMTACYEQRTTN